MTIRKLFDCTLFPLALIACLLPAATSSAADSKTIQGVLIDKECSPNAETRLVGGASPHLEGGMLWAYTHKRSCLLMPSCQRSGYGVLAYESNQYLKFDAAGNAKALSLIQGSKKEDDMRIEVTGEMQGDTVKVNTLKLLP